MNKSDLAWMEYYNHLQSIFKKTGNCFIKKGQVDTSFYNWTCRQRMNKKDGILRNDREILLKKINFNFNESWEDMFSIFTEYFTIFKSTEIPSDNKYYPVIGKWFKKQLKLLESNRLPKDKVLLYEKLGIDVNLNKKKSLDDIWFESYSQLKSIFIETGECNVPNTKEFKSLYRFIQTQRSKYKNNTLNKNKIELLKKINFTFDLWFSKYLIVKDYYIKHKNLNIPINDKTHSSIRIWINNTRADYKNNKLSSHQIKLLKEINFVFEIEACEKEWLNKYSKAKSFYFKHMHCSINPFEASEELFKWAIEQSNLYYTKKLSLNKINLLNKIKFDFNLNHFTEVDSEWIRQYKRLFYIHNKYNHYFIDYSDKNDLLKWIFQQCEKKRTNTLSYTERNLLTKINFNFNLDNLLILEEYWAKKYAILKKKFKNKDILPHLCSTNFFIWIKEEYVLYKNNDLSTYKYCLLKELNFSFDYKTFKNIDNKWIIFYKRLQNFYKKYGHYNINPFIHSQDLFEWAITQNNLKPTNKISKTKIALLNNINFTFNVTPLSKEEAIWLKHYNKLKSFKKNYGHLLVDDSKNFKNLYQWTEKQHYLKKHGLLREDFSCYLRNLNFEFKSPWETTFNRFKIYYNLHESLDIPSHKHLQYKEIDIWLKEQVRLFKNNELPNNIVDSYNELGIDLNLYM